MTVDFGFADVSPAEKTARVGRVFSAVAPHYDRMNDILSAGAHRLWKNAAALVLDVRPGMRALDIAAGSGDMSARLLPKVGAAGAVVCADINADMLRIGARRLPAACPALCDGERLPFADRAFDRVCIAFGLRNIANRRRALAEIRRVLKTGGKYVVLEFSPSAAFERAYHWHLTVVLPALGRLVADDADSYRYLGESILRFPAPDALVDMLADAGLPAARYLRLGGGGVVLHHGRRRD